MKGNSYFIDTNIFLRPITKDNAKSAEECEFLFQKIKNGNINAFTSNLVLTEVFWVLKSVYKLKKQELTRILEAISKLKNLKINNRENFDKAVELYEKNNIKFIDALIASHPKILNKEMTIISYDKDFDKLKILRKEPGNLL
jgi:predicted nucleic-acid-binding protein